MEKEHKKRIFTAIVVLPILIWIVLFSPLFLFGLFVLLVGIFATWEHAKMWRLEQKKLLYLCLCLNTLLLLFFASNRPLLGLVLTFSLLAVFFITIYRSQPELTAYLPIVTLNFLYPTLLLGYAFYFLSLTKGRFLLLWTLLIVFASDTGAFYFGSHFGKHKLYPAVSPKKSWEGLCGGMAGAFVLGLLLSPFVPAAHFKALFLAMFLTIIEQIGDFFESVLKRHAGLKDSGRILPGHGGLLDRIDGVLFALPFSYYIWQWWLK
jgi:phosphatidate cytidylyltransferase